MYVLAQGATVVRYPYSLALLRQDQSSTSFPAEMSNEELSQWGVLPVAAQDAPEYDRITETLSESDPVFDNGQWLQNWIVTEASLEEITERLDRESSLVRKERNKRLAECDWTQLSDAPVNSATWAAYRQALRDVPSQPDFPWSVVWPEQPAN